MKQNNSASTNNPSQSEYSFPRNKEQFQNVLRQAQQGQYQQTGEAFSKRQNDSRYKNAANEIDYKYDKKTENTYSFLKSLPQQHGNKNHRKTNTTSSYKHQKPVVYSRSRTKSKKRLNPAVIILPLILLVAAAAVVFFYVNNNVSYSKAEKKYFSGLIDAFLEQYDEVFEPNKANPYQKAEIKASIPAAKLANIDLNNISICTDATVSGETIYGKINASLGNNSIALENWTNREKFTNILSIPEITDLYLYLNPNVENVVSDELKKSYADVLLKISELYFELAGEPPIEKDVEFTVNDKIFKADRYIVMIDDIGIAKLFKGTADIILNNDAATELIYKSLGYKNKEELLKNENYNKALKEAEDIINGVKTDGKHFLMTVYLKNKTIVGREIVFSCENTETTSNDTSIYTVNSNTNITLKNSKEIGEGSDGKLYFNIYEIPTEKGNYTHIYFKDSQNALDNGGIGTSYPSEIYLTCEDEKSENNKKTHNGTLNLGFTDLNENSNSFTAEYSDLSFAKELFQGKINITYSDAPAFSTVVQLSTDETKSLINLSIPNILNAEVTFSPSELEFKDAPFLHEGQYAKIPSNNSVSSTEAEATEKLREDISEFIYNLINNIVHSDDNASNQDDILNDAENDSVVNVDDNSTTIAPTDESSESETMTSTESITDITESLETNPPETTPSETTVAETVTAPETKPVEAVPNQNTENKTTYTAIAPTAFIDTGDAQKITGAQIDRFNQGNYYKTEIYVDGEKNAAENVVVTELKGSFDSYIKGKVLQVDFAEGYDCDSALIILTFPAETIRNGRNYPYSSALKGLDRYMILGYNDGDGYGDKEIECYKYSDRQIGFIAEKSGYYYVVDMDDYFYNVMKTNPDNIVNE